MNTAIQYGNVLQANLNACLKIYKSCAIEQQYVDAQNAEIACRESRLAAANAAMDKCRTCSDGSKSDAAGKCRNEGTVNKIVNWIKGKIADYQKKKKEEKEKKDAEAIGKFNAEYNKEKPDKDGEVTLAPVKCNFWGGRTIDGTRQIYKDMPCGTQKCLNERKNAYIADIKAGYPDACKGGWFKNPPFPIIPEDFRKKTECSVYGTEVACLDRLLTGNVSDACKGFINKRAADIEILSPAHFGCVK